MMQNPSIYKHAAILLLGLGEFALVPARAAAVFVLFGLLALGLFYLRGP